MVIRTDAATNEGEHKRRIARDLWRDLELQQPRSYIPISAHSPIIALHMYIPRPNRIT